MKLNFLYFVIIGTIFDWFDMTIAAYLWLFAAGIVYENHRLHSGPNLIVED